MSATDVSVVPLAPSALALTADDAGVPTLSWTASASFPTAFRVERSEDGATWSVAGDTEIGAIDFVDESISEAKHYFYRVRALSGNVLSSATSPATIDTPALAASDFSVTATGPTSLALSWNSNSSIATAYRIDLSSDGGTTFNTVSSLSAGLSSCTLLNLSASTQYQIRLVTLVPAGTSLNSGPSILSVRTEPAGATPGIAANVQATYDPALTRIVVSWTSPGASATSFDVERCIDDGVWSVSSSATSSTTFIDTNIQSGHTYGYRIIARNGYGAGTASDIAYAATSVAAPTSLAATVNDDGSVTLTWNDLSQNEQGFGLYELDSSNVYQLVQILPIDLNSFTLSDIGPGGSDYRVDSNGDAVPRKFAIAAFAASTESSKTAPVTVTPSRARIEVSSLTQGADATIAFTRADTTIALNWLIDWGDGSTPALFTQDAGAMNNSFTLTHSYASQATDAEYHVTAEASSLDGTQHFATDDLLYSVPAQVSQSMTAATGYKVPAEARRRIIDAFEWVYNNVEFTPYFGFKKGATATAETRSGSAWDIALLAKQRLEAEIPKNHGATVELVEGHVSADPRVLGVMFGAYTGAEMSYLMSLLPQESTDIANTTANAFYWTHVWLRVKIPGWIGTAIDIDPSWKFHELRTWHPGLAVDPSASYHELADASDQTGQPGFWNQTEQSPLEYFETQLTKYIGRDVGSDGMAGHTSLADLSYLGSIKAKSFDELPDMAKQPSGEVYTVSVASPAFVGQDNYLKLKVQLTSSASQAVTFNQYGTKLSAATTATSFPKAEVLLADIGSEPLTIRYVKEMRYSKTGGNAQDLHEYLIARLYKGETAISFTAPEVGLTKDLFVQLSSVSLANSNVTLRVQQEGKWYTDQVPGYSGVQSWTRTIGDPLAIVIDGYQVSAAAIARQQALANEQASDLTLSKWKAQQEYQPKLLSLIGMSIVSRMDESARLLAGYTNTALAGEPSVGIGLITGVYALDGDITRQGGAGSGIINPYIFHDAHASVAASNLSSTSVPYGGSESIYTDLPGFILPSFIPRDLHAISNTANGPVFNWHRSNQAAIVQGDYLGWLESDSIERVTNIEAFSTTKILQAANKNSRSIYRFSGSTSGTDMAGHVSGSVSVNSLFGGSGRDSVAQKVVNDINATMTAADGDNTVLVVPDFEVDVVGSKAAAMRSVTYSDNYSASNPDLARVISVSVFIYDRNGAAHGGFSGFTDVSNNFNQFNPSTLWTPSSFATSDIINLGSFGGALGGDPVNMASGAVYHDETDFAVQLPGMPVVFSRHYDSTVTEDFGLGRGWLYSYCDRITTSGNDVTWTTSTGERYLFKYDSATSTYSNPSGLFGTFVKSGSGYTYTEKDQSVRSFDSTGRLVQLKDRLGNGVVVEYDSKRAKTFSKVSRLDAATGLKVSSPAVFMTYSSTSGGGKQVRVTDSLGRQWLYDLATIHTSSQALYLRKYTSAASKVDGVIGKTLTTTYDYFSVSNDARFGLLKTLTRRDGTHVRASHGFNYYPNGRAFSTTEYAGTDVDPTGKIQGTEYFNYNLFSSHYFEGGSPYLHDVEYVDQNGNLKTIKFNDATLVTRTINADRSRVDQSWLRYGLVNDSSAPKKYLLRSRTDENGLTTAFRYGSKDRGTSKEKSVNLGRVTWQIDRSYDYTTSASPHGIITTTTYRDPAQAGNRLDAVATISVNSARTTTYNYNSRGDISSIVDPLGDTTSFTYTTYGQLQTKTMPRGNEGNPSNTKRDRYTIKYYYDPITGAIDHEDRYHRYADTSRTTVATYTYDAFGNPSTTVNGAGDIVTYKYDSLGRKRSEEVDKGGLGLLTKYDYLDDLVTVVRDPGMHYTTTTYDLGGRATAVKQEINGTQTSKAASIYDAFGNLVKAQAWTSPNPKPEESPRETRYLYDDRNRLIATLQPEATFVRVILDGVGNTVRTSTPTVNNQAAASATGRYSDGANRYLGEEAVAVNVFSHFGWLATVMDPIGQKTKNTYDSFGQISQVDWYGASENGTIATSPWRTTTYGYDDLGRVTDMRSNAHQFVNTHYDRDGNADVVTTVDLSKENYPDAKYLNVRSFTLANVKGRDPKRIVTTTFDVNGRPIEVTQGDGDASTADRMVRTAYDKAGRVIASSDARAASSFGGYDDWFNAATAGSTAQIDFTTWTEYDHAGRVVKQYMPLVPLSTSVTQTTRADADYIFTQYDAIGRVKDVTTVWGPKSVLNSGQTASHLHTHYDYNDTALEVVTSRQVSGSTWTSTTQTHLATGEVRAIQDARNATTNFYYDDLGRLISKVLPVPDGAGTTATYTTEYDVAGNVLSVAAPTGDLVADGVRSITFYDALHRPIEVMQVGGNNTPTAGTILTDIATIYANNNAVQTWTLHRFDTSDPTGKKNQWAISRAQYDKVGHVIATFGNDVFTLGKDLPLRKDIGSTVAGESQLTSAEYNWFGEKTLSRVFAERGALSPTATTTRTITTQYTEFGQVKRVEQNDPDGASGARSGSWTQYLYDKAGNQTDIITPGLGANVSRSHTDYDGRNRVRRQTQVNTAGTAQRANGQSYFYNTDGTTRIQTQEKDGADEMTSFVYDSLGRLQDTSQTVYGMEGTSNGSHVPVGQDEVLTTHRTYDENDNLLTTQQNRGGLDSNNEQTTITYTYDARNRKTTEQWNITVNNSTGGHSAGFIKSAIWLGYDYDNADRVKSVVDALASGDYSERNPSVGYAYDTLGRVTKEWQGLTNAYSSQDTWTASRGGVVRSYNADGTLDTTKAYTAGTLVNAAELDSTLSYTIDGLGHVRSITQNGGTGGGVAKKVVEYTPNQGGEVQTQIVTQFGSSRTDKKSLVWSYRYDNNGVLSNIFAPNQKDDFGYGRDSRGRITSEDRGKNGQPGYQHRTFGYGADDQLINDNGASYGTDDNFNRTSGNGALGSSAIGKGDRVKEDASYKYEYDNVGNLYRRTSKTSNGPIWRYTFDARNRLIAIVKYNTPSDQAADNRAEVVRYDYDVLNRRIAVNVDADGDGSGTYTHEVYALDGSNVTRASTVTHPGGSSAPSFALKSRYFFGASVDDVLAEDDPGSTISVGGKSIAKVRWFGKDQQGSVRVVYSQNNAWSDPLSTNRYGVDYDAFGNVTTGASSLRRFGYTGQQRDDASGTWFYKARYYDPALGRFIAQDPAREGSNHSIYVFNNPMNLRDPTGLSAAFGLLPKDYHQDLHPGGGVLGTSGPSLTGIRYRAAIDADPVTRQPVVSWEVGHLAPLNMDFEWDQYSRQVAHARESIYGGSPPTAMELWKEDLKIPIPKYVSPKYYDPESHQVFVVDAHGSVMAPAGMSVETLRRSYYKHVFDPIQDAVTVSAYEGHAQAWSNVIDSFPVLGRLSNDFVSKGGHFRGSTLGYTALDVAGLGLSTAGSSGMRSFQLASTANGGFTMLGGGRWFTSFRNADALRQEVLSVAQSETFVERATALGFSQEHIAGLPMRLESYQFGEIPFGGLATSDEFLIGRVSLLSSRSQRILHELGHVLDDVRTPGMFDAEATYGFSQFYDAEKVAYTMQYGFNPAPLTAFNAAAQAHPLIMQGSVYGLSAYGIYSATKR
ncbi:MAG: RHS repeat-associated core domain-containing protein [Tepidisphaeraceae bacterium]